MQPLYRPETYPPDVKVALDKARPLMAEIANRWMLGWPKRVKALIEAGEYLAALNEQTEKELDALSQPGNAHLAHHEIAELYGLTPEPPTPTDSP